MHSRKKLAFPVTTVAALIFATVLGMPSSNAANKMGTTLFGDAVPATAASTVDSKSVELGIKFSSAKAGRITGIRFYKGASNTGTHSVTLWSARGKKLGTAVATNETTSGWQTVMFATPVGIKAGATYIASYLAPNGNYAYDESYFSNAYTRGALTVPANGSVFKYGGGFPTDSWKSANYWVDVVFADEATSATPSSQVSTSTTRVPETTSSTPRTTTTAPVNTTTTSTSTTVRQSTTTVPQSPSSGNFPNANNTGYKNAPGFPGSLSTFTGTIQSNTTYRYMYFPNGLYLGSTTNHPTNVTFIGCLFESNATEDANVAIYGNGITFDYSTFQPSKAQSTAVSWAQGYQYGIDVRSSGAVTVDHSNFWGWGNGIQFGSSTQAAPFVVRNSWFHDARDDGGKDHTDAILENYGNQSYILVDHNTISSVGNTNGLALQAGNGGYDHVTVTNNYFSGFGYTVNIGGGGKLTNSTFTGNTFGTDFKPVWGPLYGWGGSNNVWKDNKWHVVSGTTWSAASNDGKFWTPDGPSATDFQ